MWNAHDSTAIIQLDPGARMKTKPRYESRKTERGIRIKIRTKNRII